MLHADLTLRTADLSCDADGIVAVVEAHDRVWMAGQGTPAQQTLDDIARVEREGVGTTQVALDGDGVVIGYVWIEAVIPQNRSAWIDPYVHPDRAGTAEDALVSRAVEIVRDWPTSRRAKVESGTVHEDDHLAQALSRNGFSQQRTFYLMNLDLAPEHAEVPPPPPGVVVRQVSDTPRSRALLHSLCETSFRDHWNHDERTLEQFWARKEAYLGFDPTQWWVAELDGKPVGALIGDRARADDGVGHVQTLGVLREGRGRGIARHLLRTAFADHVSRGWVTTTLGVDAASPTGATALYRSVGMRETLTFDEYALDLSH